MNKDISKEEKEIIKQYLLQFYNLEKRYPLLPGMQNTGAVAKLFGLEEEELKAARTTFDEQAKQAAIEILKDDEINDLLSDLPFDGEETIVALGDSLTDDLQGWFSILTHVLEIATENPDFNFINAGISFDTTTAALQRLDRDVLVHKPDWVFVALGTFDAQRLNLATNRTLLPLSETWENLNTIQDALMEEVENELVWISPPPVIPELLADNPLYDFSIQEADLSQVRELVSGKKGFIVDPRGVRMGKPQPDAWNYLSDGLHPSLSGHSETVKHLLKVLVKKS